MHLDSLMKRLTEQRVRRIVEPVLLGEPCSYDIYDDDYHYVLDLGLLSESSQGFVVPSNRIYGGITETKSPAMKAISEDNMGVSNPI